MSSCGAAAATLATAEQTLQQDDEGLDIILMNPTRLAATIAAAAAAPIGARLSEGRIPALLIKEDFMPHLPSSLTTWPAPVLAGARQTPDTRAAPIVPHQAPTVHRPQSGGGGGGGRLARRSAAR